MNSHGNVVQSTVYHIGLLSLVAAKSAWKAGHRGLDYVKPDLIYDNGSDHLGTPLWFVSIQCIIEELKLDTAFVEWMMDRGADPFWTQPIFLTTPAHIICRYHDALGTTMQMICNFLMQKRQDSCSFHCSQDGCFGIGHTISKQRLKQHRAKGRRTLNDGFSLFALVHDHRDSTWMSSAILRVLTFEELSLTHTCCYRVFDEINDNFMRPTPEEAEVKYRNEREDIILLDKLVRDFETKWATFPQHFVTFMNRVWRPRMRAIRQEQQIDKQVCEADLLGTGLTLKDPAKEKTSRSIWSFLDPESDDLESDGSKRQSDWSDHYRSEGDSGGWYTTDEED